MEPTEDGTICWNTKSCTPTVSRSNSTLRLFQWHIQSVYFVIIAECALFSRKSSRYYQFPCVPVKNFCGKLQKLFRYQPSSGYWWSIQRQNMIWKHLLHAIIGFSHNWKATFGWSIHCESKKHATILLSVTSPNVDRFSKFFHWQTQW